MTEGDVSISTARCADEGRQVQVTHRMLASSLLMRFSSSSRALAFLRSAMNCTSPRMLELLLLERPRKPPAADDAMTEVRDRRTPVGQLTTF